MPKSDVQHAIPYGTNIYATYKKIIYVTCTCNQNIYVGNCINIYVVLIYVNIYTVYVNIYAVYVTIYAIMFTYMKYVGKMYDI